MKGIYFNGKRYLRPQAISRIDDTGMYGRGLSGGNTIAIIGEATGGDPKKVLWFTDPSYAKSIFRSGNLLTAIQRAYDPSTEGGAYLMAAIRVNPALQSSLNLKDTSGHNLITLTSVDYGAWNNQIKARVETGSKAGEIIAPYTPSTAKKVTITYGTSEDQGDNIYKKSLYVALSDPLALTGLLSIDTIGTKLMTFAVTASYQKAYYDTGSGSPLAWSGTTPAYSTALTLNTPGVSGHYIYIGSDIPFNKLNWVLGAGVANTAVAAVLAGQYWNGSVWTTLPNFTDNTKLTPPGTATLSALTGTVTFYPDQYTYPTGWIKTATLQHADGTTFTKEELYWVRIYVTAASCAPAGACSVSPGFTLTRNRSASLTTYSTIQQLSDYVDSLFGFESGVLTASPLVDLSTDLDDVTNANIMSTDMACTTLSGGYDPAGVTPRVIAVTLLTDFTVGDYIAISRADGSSEEIRKISAKSVATGAGNITMDSALSTTYITGSIVREAKVLDSDIQAVIDWLNNGNTAYVTAAAYASIADRAPLANVADTYMTGGTDGSPQQVDWDECLDLLKTEDTPLVTCVSPEPSIWASLSTHVTYMSTVGKKERRGFCGGFSVDDGYTGGLGKWTTSSLIVASINQMLNYAEDLNSDRMYYVGPGFIAYDENGVKTTYNGCFSAALAAGLASALDVAEPLTHKSIKVLGLEYNLKWADLDQLLEGGVFPLEYDPGFGYRVCQSISTWLVNDNYYRRELSTGRVGDLVARNVRDRLEQDFVGRKGTTTTLISIKNATISVLAMAYRDGYLAGDATNPPYKNIQVRLDGDIAYVDFECSPVIPVNYIPITIHLTVYTATMTA